MLKLGELAVRLADLAEAEGRLLKHHAVRLAGVMLLLILATILTLVGLLLLAGSCYLAMARGLGHPAALAITGVIVTVGGIFIAAAAHGYHHATKDK